VENGAVNETIARALAELPVKDLTVENAPLEEVMSEIFSRNKDARAESA
jgi:ABC-2 type transport system ATP-binding protein